MSSTNEQPAAVTNREIDTAFAAMRGLQGGLEPYAPAVLPMARDLREPQFRGVVVQQLEAKRGEVPENSRAAWWINRALMLLG